MLQLSQVAVGHGTQILFTGVNLSLSGKDRKRVGLLGDNGCGKSTLMATILGETPPVKGTVTLHGERVLAIHQEHSVPQGLVGEYLEALLPESWMEYRIPLVLEEVGLSDDIVLQETGTLSGGQRLRLRFAAALLEEPTILLLDEPTNHLDGEGLAWLGKFIHEFDGSVIMITHDRWFINTHLKELWYVDLTMETVRTYTGNYDAFLEWKAAEEEHLRNAYAQVEQQKKELQRWLREHENHTKYQFSNILMGKRRRLASLERLDPLRPVEPKLVQLTMHAGISKDQWLMHLAVEGHPYISGGPLQLTLRSQSRVRLQGPNGAGKTTLLRCIAGEGLSTGVSREVREGLRIGMLTQDSSLPKERAVITVAHEWLYRYQESTVRSILHKLGFGAEDLRHPVGSFSPGEQRKLELGLLLATGPELLLLDEPTNHMDIATRELMEELLTEAPVALVYISHDEYFAQKIGGEVVEVGIA